MLTAFLDASVLYPALLRDLLMRLALHGVFQARWSLRVHEEWTTALLRNRPDLSRDEVDRTRRLMDLHMPDASVTGFEARIAALELPDADDRHVLAAALHCDARMIVTSNLRYFPPDILAPFALNAVHPDMFLASTIRAEEASAIAAVRRLLAAFKRPPMDSSALLAALRRAGLPETVEALRRAGL